MSAPDPETRQDMDLGVIVLITVVSIILVLVTVVAGQAWFRWEVAQEVNRKQISQDYTQLDAVRAEQTEQLSAYRVVDEENNLYAIPIEEAMRIVAEQATR